MKRIRRIFKDASVGFAARLNECRYRVLSFDAVDRLASLRMPNAGLLPHIMIDPRRIEFKCNIRGADAGTDLLFRSGDWDCKRKSFADVEANDPRYVTCRELMRDRMPVEETMEFGYLLDRISRHGRAHGSSSRDDLVRYLSNLRTFYETIERDGRLLTQAELGRPRHGGEINCAVDRDGVLLKIDKGNHRFAIARLLGIKAVPVQISVIHSDQLEFVRAQDRTSGLRAVNAYMHLIGERYRS
ncbi:MAG: hypothetical protein FDZ69_03800 [Deltaproteobacteria bacterium]|nr:MAG: hypothetical protein FDZ69_03800 [Deltaproteobacteria bacterium]